jgi:hypothetical protein
MPIAFALRDGRLGSTQCPVLLCGERIHGDGVSGHRMAPVSQLARRPGLVCAWLRWTAQHRLPGLANGNRRRCSLSIRVPAIGCSAGRPMPWYPASDGWQYHCQDLDTTMETVAAQCGASLQGESGMRIRGVTYRPPRRILDFRPACRW